MCLFYLNSVYSHSQSCTKWKSVLQTQTWTELHSHTSRCDSGIAHHHSLRTVIVINHACPLHQNLPTELVWGLDIINVSANCQVIFTWAQFLSSVILPLCYLLHILCNLSSGWSGWCEKWWFVGFVYSAYKSAHSFSSRNRWIKIDPKTFTWHK